MGVFDDLNSVNLDSELSTKALGDQFTTGDRLRFTNPLIEAPFLRNAQEIDDLLFSNANCKVVDNVQIITEKDVDPEPYVRSFKVFKDLNNNNTLDEQESVLFRYTLKVFVSKDVSYLEMAFEKNAPEPDEICIFLEDNRGDFLSGKTARIKIGSSFADDFEKLTTLSDLKKKILIDALNEYYKDVQLDFTPDEIQELITTGKLENASLSILTGIFQAANASTALLTPVYKAVGNAMSDVADFLKKNIKFQPEHWDPLAKVKKDPSDDSPDAELIDNPNFEPVLFPFSNQIVDTLTVPVEENLQEMVQQFMTVLQEKDQQIQSRIAQLDTFVEVGSNVLIDILTPTLLKPLAQTMQVTLPIQLTEQYQRIRPYIFKGLERLSELIQDLDVILKRGLNAVNAFICGLWNSIADTLIGIFDLLGLLFKGLAGVGQFTLDAKEKLPRLLELIDSFVQYATALDYSAIFGAIVEAVKKTDFGALAQSITIERLAYYIGAFVGFVVEMIVEALLTGGIKNVQTLISKIGSLADNMLSVIQSAVQKFFGKSLKNLGNDLVGLLAKIVELLSKGTDEIVRMIRVFFAELQKIGKQTQAILNFAKGLAKALKDLGVRWVDEIVDGKPAVLVTQNGEQIFLGSPIDFFDALQDFNKAVGVNKKKLQTKLDEIASGLGKELFSSLKKRGFKIVKGKGARKFVDVIDENGDIRFRGTQEEVKKFVQKMALSDQKLKKELKGVIKKSLNSRLAFDPNKKGLEVLRQAGIFIKKSKIGLVPDFSKTSRFLYKGEKKFGEVKIKLTGVDAQDFKLANEAAKILGDIPKGKNAPANYTWHHMDDYDPITGECTMQLVLTEIHELTFPHKGGAGIIEELFNVSRK